MSVWIPADRFLAVVDKDPNLSRNIEGTHADRRVRELRSGRQQFISLGVADKILTRLHLNHWWHLPPEAGGLADIYEDGAQYGAPHETGTRYPADTRVRYATETERLEARRRTYRDSKRRAYDRKETA